MEKGGGGVGVGEGGWYRGWKGGVLEFLFFEKRGGGVWRGGMVGLGVSLGAVLGEWV